MSFGCNGKLLIGQKVVSTKPKYRVKLSKAILASGLTLILALGCKNENNGGFGGNGKEYPNKDDPTPTIVKHTLSITKPTNGTITSDPGDINCGGGGGGGSEGSACKAEFDKDTEVTLNAKADTGYAPGAWQGACDKTDAG